MVIVKVYANYDALRGDHRLFEREVTWDHSVKFPLDEIYVSMKALFGQKSVVIFAFD